MWVYFFGLLGPNGPMPLHLTEYAERRQSFFKDRTLARFLDVFHHRMISFFYRAWACSQLTVSRDRPQADRFGAYVASTFGLGMDSLRNRDSVPDTAKLHYSGRLACPTRNAEGLEAILSDYFGVKAEIEQFVGQWIDLPKDCCCRVGESRSTGLLGSTVIVGARTWDCQQKFRIKLGPMSFADYERMLPGGESFRRLRDWVRNYVGDELSWDVQLVLKADEVPTAQLGKTGRMGWTTWMKSRPTEKDVDDLVLIPS
jgi:type VI secretion system protein ImpH